MDFELTDDQTALADGIAALCTGRFDIEAVRAMATNGLDRGRWQELAATGVFGLALPEADGGVGLGWAEATIVFEKLGQYLVPGPLVATTLAAGLIDGAVEGSVVVAHVERATGPMYVEFVSWADVVVIVDDDGLWQVAAADLGGVAAKQPLDALTPVSVVDALPQGERIGDAASVAVWRRRGALLTSALQLGLAIGATNLAVEYAKERQQFGKAVGAFQAVKHRCADMITRVEVLRAAVYAAAVNLDGLGVGDADRAVAVAKVLASSAASNCGKDCVQVHGGMGYTWEVDAHLYLKRAWVLEHTFGDANYHADALASRI